MAVRIDDLNVQRMASFKNRLRMDKRFLHEFYVNPIAVLDKEMGIHIDPNSRIGRELVAKLKRKGEDDWVPQDFTCWIVGWGKKCIVVSEPESV